MSTSQPCARILPSRIRYTVFLAIPCFLASIAPTPSYLGAALISATASALILVLLFCAPYRIGGFVPRPLASLSAILSASVPTHRCRGLVHSGLSQSWQTKRPGGTGPFATSHATLLAMKFVPPKRTSPYPAEFLDADHPQQSSSPRFTVFASNEHANEQCLPLGDRRRKAVPQVTQENSWSFQYLGMSKLVEGGR